MPVDAHAFTSKKSTWEKHLSKKNAVSSYLQEIFMGKEEIEISRRDLFDLAKSGNYPRFIISTILWGYPAGMRGNHFETITNKIDVLSILLQEASSGIKDWKHHYSMVSEIRGLGLSTYTKFLYFIEAKIDSFPCVILDKRIIDAINKRFISDLSQLVGIQTYNASTRYPDFLKVIDRASNKYEATHGQVEMFIFEFGINMKA